MHHGRQQTGVELLLHVALILDRVAQVHARGKENDRHERGNAAADLRRVQRAGAVGRCGRHHRLAQHVERHVAHELAGLLRSA